MEGLAELLTVMVIPVIFVLTLVSASIKVVQEYERGVIFRLGRLVGDGLTMGGQSLHVCCGASQLGDVRLDLDACHSPDVLGDGARLPFPDDAFDVLLCDPPYTGRLQWNHDLLSELARVARRRLVFQHWYVPATAYGYYRECRWKFALTELYLWLPRTYFGRAQVVSVWDRRWGLGPEADGRM